MSASFLNRTKVEKEEEVIELEKEDLEVKVTIIEGEDLERKR